MTNESANFESEPRGERFDADELAFRAAVDAAFGDASPAGYPAAEPARVAEVRAILAAMAESSLDLPSEALRERVLAVFPSRTRLVERFVREAARIAMELLSPPPAQALAGFRIADVPVRTYRTRTDSALEAWLDLQVDREPVSTDGRRVRGQVSIESGGDVVPTPVAVHTLDSASGRLVGSVPIGEDGSFSMRVDVPQIDLLVELDSGEGALSVPAITLRTDVT